jgi:hypothetical protein
MSICLPVTSNVSRLGRSYVVMTASYGWPRLTVVKREPWPIGSPEFRSERETWSFHCVSLRASALRSKTSSTGRAMV